MTVDLISRARAGDGEAFRALTEPHRRELQVHCYRMLGSLQDAEDALQDTLLAAWKGLEGFEGRASIRTWLYRIATTRCLNVLRAASRRPAKEWDMPRVEPPEPTRRGSAHHICLEVPDMDKSTAILAGRAAGAGYTRPLEIRTGRNRRRQLNIFDPDGTRTELMEPRTVDGQPAPSSQAPPPK